MSASMDQDHQDVHVHGAGDGDNGGVRFNAQDFQNIRLLIDIGDNRAIEIPLRGNVILQNSGPPQAAAAGGDASPGNAAAQGQSAPAQQADEDKEFLDKMRGWLMTVATLFVGIAFQAATQPPEWIPKDWFGVLLNNLGMGASSPLLLRVPPSPAAEAAAISMVQAWAVFMYVLSNAVTFATALTVVVMLLMKKSLPGRTMTIVTLQVAFIAAAAASTFAFAAAYDAKVCVLVFCIIVLYVAATVSYIRRKGLRYYMSKLVTIFSDGCRRS